ncbi:phage major capsid protein [Microbacterium lacticum]
MTVFTTTNDVKGISPDKIHELITLPVERESVAIQTSTLVPTEATRTHIPLVTGDPSASWVAEGDEIGATDPTIDDIIATPAKIAGLTIVTNELAADTTPAAANIIGDGLSRDIAKKIDLAYFGRRGASVVQPNGLEDLVSPTLTVLETAWANLDPFAEAISNAEILGLELTSFVANPADALILAKLKEATGSNKPLLGSDPTNPTKRTLQGVQLLTSPGVRVGTIWGVPASRSIIVRRADVDLAVDRSAYFTSDRTAIRATMRVTFAFPQPAGMQRVMLGSDAVPTISAATPSAAATNAVVTITGTKFVGTLGVTFGGVAAPNFTVVSPTSLQAIVPAGTAGSANIIVTNNKGASSAFTYTRG